MRFRALVLLLLLLATFVAGCGGVASKRPVASSLAIAWPARTRTFNAPATAYSFRANFQTPGGGTQSFNFNRPSGDAASTMTYEVPRSLQPGDYILTLEFMSGPDGLGSVVGIASLEVRLNGSGFLQRRDGRLIGTIAFEGQIGYVWVMPDQEFQAPSRADLAVYVFNLDGQQVVVDPGLIRVTVNSGSNVIAPLGGTEIDVLSEGQATVVASIEGVASDEAFVRAVGTNIQVASVPLRSAQIAFDATRNTLWLTSPSGAGGMNAVVPVNLGTLAIGTPLVTGNDPTSIAITDDASKLYVGLRDTGTIQEFDLSSQTLGNSFPVTEEFPGGTYAGRIYPQPGSNSKLAVLRVYPAFTRSYGPEIYENGVALPDRDDRSTATVGGWTSTSQFATYDAGTIPFSLGRWAMNASGATLSGSEQDVVSGGGGVTFAGGRAYGASGEVGDVNSLTQVGRFEFPAFASPLDPPAIDLAGGRAIFIERGITRTYLIVYRLSDFSRLTVRRLEGVPEEVGANFGDRYDLLVCNGSTLVIRAKTHVVTVPLP